MDTQKKTTTLNVPITESDKRLVFAIQAKLQSETLTSVSLAETARRALEHFAGSLGVVTN